MLEYLVINLNLGTRILYFLDFLYKMTRAGKAGEVSLCVRMFDCQLKLAGVKFQHIPFFLSQTENLVLSFLAKAFMAYLQGAIFPNLFMNFSLIVGNLSPASFKWQTNIFSPKIRIHLPPQSSSSCTKNLESIKCQFLNYLLLFLTQYSNKDY